MPITKRKTSQGFLVITATDFNSKMVTNMHEMAKLNITLLIFMGVHLAEDIVELLKQIRPADFPIGIFPIGWLTRAKKSHWYARKYYLTERNLLDSSNKCNWEKINRLFFQKKRLKSLFL